MKTSRYEGGDIRCVVAHMARDPAVCAALSARWPQAGGLLGNPAADLLGGLIAGYYKQYGAPPNGQLGGLLVAEAERVAIPDETVAGAERLLAAVEEESQVGASPEYILDVAARVASRAKARRLHSDAEEALDRGDIGEYYETLADAAPVDLRPAPGLRLAVDFESWGKALDTDRRKPLITWGGEMANFFSDVLQRGTLFAFMGPDKSGKSFWLLETAYQALRGGCRVAYFEVGDLGEEEMLYRIGSRAARRPEQGGTYRYPTGWEAAEGDEDGRKTAPTFEYRDGGKPLEISDAFKALRKVCRGQDRFVLSCHANDSINTVGIAGIVAGWGNWRPDVMVVDYADILAPPPGKFGEKHEQIDQTWKHLRRLSQELDCLMLTATQSSSLAYSAGEGLLGPKHFSGGKTKLAHVNGMIGINATPSEKENGVTRLNWVVRRRGRFSPRQTVRVAGCLDIACPAIISTR